MNVIGVIVEDEKSHNIMEAALKVLESVASKYSLELSYKDLWVGKPSLEKYGLSLTESTVSAAMGCDMILASRSEKGYSNSLELAGKLSFGCNLRWLHAYKNVYHSLGKSGDCGEKSDIYIVSDVLSLDVKDEEAIYVDNGIVHAKDSIRVSETDIDLIVRLAFELAKKRKNRLTYVDRSNILQTAKLWGMVVKSVRADYPDFDFKDCLIEDFITESFGNLRNIDMVLTDSYLADIISTHISTLAGAMSLSSVYMNKSGKGIYGIYNPFGNEENPIGLILSISMMLKFFFGNEEAADEVVKAVAKVIDAGCYPIGIFSGEETQVSAVEFGIRVAGEIGSF